MRYQELYDKIERRLLEEANKIFDPEEAMDSDGYDQSAREGILLALEVVKEELS